MVEFPGMALPPEKRIRKLSTIFNKRFATGIDFTTAGEEHLWSVEKSEKNGRRYLCYGAVPE
jgi:hypothetical protein